MDLTKERDEIEALGLGAVKDYFKVDMHTLDPKFVTLLHQKAKLAMQFEREINLSKRAIELNYIRVFKMVASDKDELKKYVRASMPKYKV